jgi:transposase
MFLQIYLKKAIFLFEKTILFLKIAVIIMDNAVIHKSKMIREKIEDNHNYLLYSVPYHPETNSIEEFFSQLKHYIKKESPNTYEDIDTTIKDVLANKIKKEHLTNYLKHSYRIYK